MCGSDAFQAGVCEVFGRWWGLCCVLKDGDRPLIYVGESIPSQSSGLNGDGNILGMTGTT